MPLASISKIRIRNLRVPGIPASTRREIGFVHFLNYK
jgi:hypothetical protein